jgi:hypothetical protein
MEKGSLRSGNTFLFPSLKMAPFRPEIKAHTSLFVPWQRSIQAPDLREFFATSGKRAQTFFPYQAINTIIYWSLVRPL